jgi:hypothetical protein
MPELFDERSAATVLSCSVALIRKWRLFGEGPAYCKIGRLVRHRPGSRRKAKARKEHRDAATTTLDRIVRGIGSIVARRAPCGFVERFVGHKSNSIQRRYLCNLY